MTSITSAEILTALKDKFKLTAFLPVQEQVITRLCVENEDCALILPTGGGKSLTYQLPGILLPNLTLVVSPLIALMKDQVEGLRKKGIEAANLDSSLSTEAYAAVSRDVRSNKIKILYVSPERLNNEGFMALVKSIKISLLAIDEAHCVSEWGHSFRPEYLKLARFREEANVDRVLCLTATATEPVVTDITESFGIDKGGLFKTKSYRRNLDLRTYTTSTEDKKLQKLLEILDKGGDSIVYATTQKDTVDISEALNSKLGDKSKVRIYHAGMKSETRNEVQEWFMDKSSSNEQKIVVCTIAFGMGIDKSDIRQVVHYKMPKNLEGYSQEIGRAGRDGKTSVCSLFINPHDVPTLQGFIRGDTPSRDSIRRLFTHIFQNSPSKKGDLLQINRNEQEKLFDIRSSPLGLIYVYLDIQHHILRETTPKYTAYKYQILHLGTYSKDNSPVAKVIKQYSTKKTKWHDFEIEKAVAVGSQSRMAILEKLNEWSEKGVILKEAGGVLNQYKLERDAPDAKELDEIADDMYKQMIEKEKQSIDKLQNVIAFATAKECLAAKLAEYFGDKDAVPEGGCQLCSWCMSEQVASFNAPPKKDAAELKVLVEPILAACSIRDDPKFLTRIAYGITSPRYTLLKSSLNKDKKTEEKQKLEDVFGSLEEEDYDLLSEVFEQVCQDCNYKSTSAASKATAVSGATLKRKAPSNTFVSKFQRPRAK